MKPFWQSKTFWFNAIVLLVAVFEALGQLNLSWLNPEIVVVVLTIGNVLLRFVTKEPVTLK